MLRSVAVCSKCATPGCPSPDYAINQLHEPWALRHTELQHGITFWRPKTQSGKSISLHDARAFLDPNINEVEKAAALRRLASPQEPDPYQQTHTPPEASL